MKKICYLLVFTLLTLTSFSQKRELGEVTIQELQEKQCPIDTSAVASVIFNIGKTYFDYSENDGFTLNTEVDTKIKIYKKDGYKWATIEIPYYIGSSKNESVVFSKAITYNLVNGKIEKTKAKNENEFTLKKNKFWEIKKITLPAVKEGSIVEYRYTIKSPYLTNFPEWEFQKEIPVLYSQYDTKIPEYFIYNSYLKGMYQPKKTTDNILRKITIDNKKITSKGYAHDIQNIELTENSASYILENIPALNDESFVNNIKNYSSSIIHELSGEQFPNSSYKSYASTWEDVTKNIYENEDFGNQIKKTGYFEEDIKTITEKNINTVDKMYEIFDFVQKRMNWDGYLSILADKGVKKAYQDKTGNSAEINLMLVAMLQHSGIDAYPVLISTRANGISVFPSRTAFNTVIASVTVNDKQYLMDATSKLATPNILPLRDLNWFGRLIKKDGSSEMIELMPKEKSMIGISSQITIDSNQNINANVREQYTDYESYVARDKKLSLSEDEYLSKKEKNLNNIEIQDYTNENLNNINDSFIERYKVSTNKEVEKIGNNLYFSPMFFFREKENLFKQEEREYPIDFHFPFNNSHSFSIQIPDGYEIESLPKTFAVKTPNDYALFKYLVSQSDNLINVQSTLEINTSIIPSEDYEYLKEFFKNVIDKQNEKVVLKKK